MEGEATGKSRSKASAGASDAIAGALIIRTAALPDCFSCGAVGAVVTLGKESE